MKQRLMGSKKFWMVLVAILGVFILMASVFYSSTIRTKR